MAMNRREKQKRTIRYVSAKDWVEKQEAGFESASVKLPSGVTWFSMKKEGIIKVDVVPYIVGKGNPDADEGMVGYQRTYYCHKNIGPEEKVYTCMARTYGEKCCVCEEYSRLKLDPDTTEARLKSLKPQMRQLWLFRDVKDKTLMLYDAAYFKSFGEMMKDKLAANEDYQDFFKLSKDDGGYTLALSIGEDSFATEGGSVKFKRVKNIEMLPRKEDLPEEILDEAPCLDDLIKPISYKELRKIFFQMSENGEEEEDEKPVRKSKKVDPDEEDEQEDQDTDDEESDEEGTELTVKDIDVEQGDFVTHKKLGKCSIAKVTDKGKRLTLEDHKGKLHKDILVKDVKALSDEDEEEESPRSSASGAKKSTKAVRKTVDPDDEDEDTDSEDEDSDDDEPVAKKSSGKKVSKKAKDEDEDSDDSDEDED